MSEDSAFAKWQQRERELKKLPRAERRRIEKAEQKAFEKWQRIKAEEVKGCTGK